MEATGTIDVPIEHQGECHALPPRVGLVLVVVFLLTPPVSISFNLVPKPLNEKFSQYTNQKNINHTSLESLRDKVSYGIFFMHRFYQQKY